MPIGLRTALKPLIWAARVNLKAKTTPHMELPDANRAIVDTGPLVRLRWDVEQVESWVDNGQQHVLEATPEELLKWGQDVANTASKLQKKGLNTSRPGQPPVAHTSKRQGLRDIRPQLTGPRDKPIVIVGPVIKRTKSSLTGQTPIPNVLEFGGMRLVPVNTKMARRMNLRRGVDVTIGGKKYVIRRFRYEKRPFMRPAMELELSRGMNRFTLSLFNALKKAEPN